MSVRPKFPALAAAFAALALLAPPGARAQATDSEKLDSLMEMSRQVVRTVKNDPLAGKRFGVEFNFVRLLIFTEQLSVSGGVSLFGIDRNAEIALPFLYSRSETSEFEGACSDCLSAIDFTEFTQDVHYRYFLGNTQNGFYLSGFARAAYLSGIEGETALDIIGEEEPTNHRSSEGKIGVGVGLGWRKFSYRGLYWGTSLNIGRYLLGRNDVYRNGFFSIDNDAEIIFDFEFFKFGWAF